jgi:hypothetical protein
MGSLSRTLLVGLAGLALLVIFAVLLHLGGKAWEFSQLTCALISGLLTLYSVLMPKRAAESVEPWLGHERLAWILIGCGLLAWAGGETIWRYYSFIHQNPFPSLADVGYASLPPLLFTGLLLQPSSGIGSQRLLMMFDSLVAMGSMLTIGWSLLLGSLALASGQDLLAKFLGLYYPTTDIALLSCVVLLLFRGRGSLYQATARRVSLITIGIGLCFFASSDFIFNLQQNAGIYVEGTWTDLGWPLGMLAIGAAAYLRRFLPLTPGDIVEQRLRRYAELPAIGLAQLAAYSMLCVLCIVLVLNTFSSDHTQVADHPVLVLATIVVIAMVVVRQILTIYENEQLARRQAHALERLEDANRQVAEQAQMIADRNKELEEGIGHLKDIQARLANGDLRARALLIKGDLLPLAVSLNLMAERLAHLEDASQYARCLTRALQDLIIAVEQTHKGRAFHVPPSCQGFPEIRRLIYLSGLKPETGALTQPPHTTHASGAILPQPLNRSTSPLSPGTRQRSQPLSSLDSHHSGVATPVPNNTIMPPNNAKTPLPNSFFAPGQDKAREAKQD